MKIWKNLTTLTLALCIAAGILIVPDMNAFAKTKVSDTNVTIATNQIDDKFGSYEEKITVTYSKKGSYIKKLKSNSKNLLVRQTNQSVGDKTATLSFYAKKTGNYKVTFDVYNKKGKKEKHFTVKVKAIAPPIKSITFAGQKILPDPYNNLALKTSGIFNVITNKEYEVTGIHVFYPSKTGKYYTSEQFENNTEITLGTYPFKKDEMKKKKKTWSYSYNNDLFAMNDFQIDIVNTKTKKEYCYKYKIYTLVE